PLTLLNFTGREVNNQVVQLQWTTTGEINTKNFEVEWRNDASQFDKIAVLPAAINSAQNEQYSFTHSMPSEGNNYYRLKMVDQDGRFTYSPEIKISVGNTIAKVTVFPNPVVDVLTLTIEAINTETMVCNLFNADGKLVTTKSFAVKKGSNKFSWNLAQMAKGNYFITSINNHFETIKIIRE
ncbi:MAG: T9SS type A sorting domain-containing protein, partial [Ferruginibacter sp.]